MRFAFIMDPLGGVDIDKDTTFALMFEAQQRGHVPYYLAPTDLFLDRGELCARVRRAELRRVRGDHYTLDEPEDVSVGDLDAVLQRKDPPFDQVYLASTLMLEHARGKTLVVNDPLGLRDANEKLYTCWFPELMPETLVTNDPLRIRAFVDRVGGRAVIKPLFGAGGSGVMVLARGDLNVAAIIETVSREGRELVMVQRYLPEVREGDKRILLLDGEPLGAILRVPRHDDARSNIHVGGRVAACDLDERDLRICAGVRDRVRQDGLYFVGLDVIGGHLTEVNVTSPTGIQEMSRLSGHNLEAKVIDWLESKPAPRKR